MEKEQILDIIYSSIIQVSPFAAEQIEGKDYKSCKDIFFVDLGVNSIEYTEIAFILMDKLDVEVPLDLFVKTNRISEVADIFYQLKNPTLTEISKHA